MSSVCVCVCVSVKTLAAHRRARLNEAQTLHQFFRDIDDEEAWIKYVVFWMVVVQSFCYVSLSPNSIAPTFTETSPRGKSWTQITKVTDTKHLDMSRCLRQSPWQVHDKLVCVALMEFSLLQCTDKVGNKVHDKVRGQSRGLVANTNHESRRHALCRRLSWCVREKSRTLSQSRCNGIWALPNKKTFSLIVVSFLFYYAIFLHAVFVSWSHAERYIHGQH